ncbi:hypothetical protein LSAT2_029770 [Lamellibrachia satsuma]|nr:hypothetical protein LSAT2_029770 [Lamellibrachia satsuma]
MFGKFLSVQPLVEKLRVSGISVAETMRVIIVLLFACFALSAYADDNAAQLEEKDEDASMILSDVSDEVSGRSKREENPLLAVHSRTRRHAYGCRKRCKKGSCYCMGRKCRCYCTWSGLPVCRARGRRQHTCGASCRTSCRATGRCVRTTVIKFDNYVQTFNSSDRFEFDAT